VPNITAYFAKPFVELYTGGDRAPDPQAFYSIAEAKRKRGNYQEAVAEIRKELALFPNDFSGQMLLAEILADDLKDLAQAQFTLEQLLSPEGHTPKNLAYAMNRLADWHLKLGRDPAAAQQALERITRQFPNTELAYLASQRIAHLGPFQAADKEAKPRTVVLKHYEENLGLREDFTGLKAPPEDNTGAAADLVKRLEECPTDNEARERLARLYAERFARLDLAADQLEQLIAQPGAPTRQVVHWLNLLADNQIKLAGNLVAARQALQRIVDRFPNSSEADKARQRMCFLGLELKGQQQGQAVKLGSYDQYPGLKPEWPEGPPGPKS
jgi:outer membrane protein assembly factor BamD (BamD/ComL family)